MGRLFACSAAPLLWSLAAWRAAPLEAQPAQSRAFVECDRDELIRAVPELASMQSDSTQDRLPGRLPPAGENLEGMFARLVDVAATEQIHEMRFEDGAESRGRWETYRYLVGRLAEGSPEPFTELRIGQDPKAPTPALADGFLVIAHFEKLLRPSGGDSQGIRVYRSDAVSLRSAEAKPPRSVHRLDEPTGLSLGMVASPQSPLPFRPAESL